MSFYKYGLGIKKKPKTVDIPLNKETKLFSGVFSWRSTFRKDMNTLIDMTRNETKSNEQKKKINKGKEKCDD